MDTDRNILIVRDDDGKELVVLPRIIFAGKKSVPWNEVERYLACYIGRIVEIAETKDIVYIGKDFSDEFSGSAYTRKLKGAIAKAKANLVQGIPEMVEISTKRRWAEDYENRHKKKAQKGWYRYNTRFAMPVTDDTGTIVRYNVYQAVVIVRYAADDRLYLYDIQNIKKETSNPL